MHLKLNWPWWANHIQARMHGALGFPRPRFYCPACKTSVFHWQPFVRVIGDGVYRREPGGRVCPHCHSMERTRQMALYFERQRTAWAGKRMLHFAPEAGLARLLRGLGLASYTTTDLMQAGVDVAADITQLPFADASFDIIYCSNVLEHIPDDRKAMSELFRVLAPAGLCIIQVPIKGEKTYEDASITRPEARAAAFGQADHVRWYGRDVSQRLEAAGFVVREVMFPDELALGESELRRINGLRKGLHHFCTRP